MEPLSSLLVRTLLPWAYYLLYNQFAWAYDLAAWTVSLGQWRDWGRAVLPCLRGPRVLDLAHGPGHLAAEIKVRGYQVVGHDLSPSMSRLARHNVARLGVTVPLSRGLVQGLPFPAGSFNSVIATFPAGFILQLVTWREVRRVLADDGIFLVVLTAIHSGGGILARWQKLLNVPDGDSFSPGINMLNQLAADRFNSTVEWIALPRSQVLLIRSYPLSI